MENQKTAQFRKALSYLKAKNKLTIADLSEIGGCSSRHIQSVLSEKEKKGAGHSVGQAIASAMGISYEYMLYLGQWIIEGKNPDALYEKIMLLEKAGRSSVHQEIRINSSEMKIPADAGAIELPPAEENAFCLVPKYKARLSGGHGSFEVSDQVEANLAFRKDWISRKSANGLALFEVIGDSMAPFIQEGDIVMVDLADNDPQMIVDGKTYAIREDNTVKIKRLVRQGGKLLIRSQDQTLYPDYEAGGDVHLIGRVIWVGHEVK